MPIYVFTCDNGHSFEKYKQTMYKRTVRYRCKKCGLFARRDYRAERTNEKRIVHINPDNEPMSHLLKKRSFKGAWIENLTPEPVFVSNKTQYQGLLKRTHSREKVSGYAGE